MCILIKSRVTTFIGFMRWTVSYSLKTSSFTYLPHGSKIILKNNTGIWQEQYSFFTLSSYFCFTAHRSDRRNFNLLQRIPEFSDETPIKVLINFWRHCDDGSLSLRARHFILMMSYLCRFQKHQKSNLHVVISGWAHGKVYFYCYNLYFYF